MEKFYAKNEHREKIYRFQDEIEYPLLPPQKKIRLPYPWELAEKSAPRALVSSDFSCKGRKQHADRVIMLSGQEERRFSDCEGGEAHGIPEITPILLTLLNHIQETTGRHVVITSGHRCSQHQRYLYPGDLTSSSLYTVGAACDFYVEGLENSPQTVIKIIQEYYRKDKQTAHDPSYTLFHRLPLDRSQVITPWVNREICLIVHTEQEHRNPDNAHNHPYISLLVHFDRLKNRSIESELRQALPAAE